MITPKPYSLRPYSNLHTAQTSSKASVLDLAIVHHPHSAAPLGLNRLNPKPIQEVRLGSQDMCGIGRFQILQLGGGGSRVQRACESVAHCIARIVSVGHVTVDKKKPKPHLYVPIMAAGSQMPKDIEARIRAMPGNTTCVDCNNNAPQWASVTYGTLMCLEPWRQRA